MRLRRSVALKLQCVYVRVNVWIQCSCAIAIACSLEYKFMELADTCVKRYVNATFANEPGFVSFFVQSRFLFQFNDKIK